MTPPTPRVANFLRGGWCCLISAVILTARAGSVPEDIAFTAESDRTEQRYVLVLPEGFDPRLLIAHWASAAGRSRRWPQAVEIYRGGVFLWPYIAAITYADLGSLIHGLSATNSDNPADAVTEEDTASIVDDPVYGRIVGWDASTSRAIVDTTGLMGIKRGVVAFGSSTDHWAL